MKLKGATFLFLSILAAACGGAGAEPAIDAGLTCDFVPADHGVTDPLVGFLSYADDGGCAWRVTVLRGGARVELTCEGGDLCR